MWDGSNGKTGKEGEERKAQAQQSLSEVCLLPKGQTEGKPSGRWALKRQLCLCLLFPPCVPSYALSLVSEFYTAIHVKTNRKSFCFYVKTQFNLSSIFISTSDVTSLTSYITHLIFFHMWDKSKLGALLFICSCSVVTLERTNFVVDWHMISCLDGISSKVQMEGCEGSSRTLTNTLQTASHLKILHRWWSFQH